MRHRIATTITLLISALLIAAVVAWAAHVSA
jgi:hypothetical protein